MDVTDGRTVDATNEFGSAELGSFIKRVEVVTLIHCFLNIIRLEMCQSQMCTGDKWRQMKFKMKNKEILI